MRERVARCSDFSGLRRDPELGNEQTVVSGKTLDRGYDNFGNAERQHSSPCSVSVMNRLRWSTAYAKAVARN